MTTIQSAIDSFLLNVKRNQPNNTYKNYRSDLLGVSGFLPCLENRIKPKDSASSLSEDMAAQFIQLLLDAGAAPATRQRKAAAVREFYRFAIATDLANVSIEKLNYKIKSGKLLAGKKRHIEFPKEKIEKVLSFVRTIKPAGKENEILIRRNQAFIFCLAESGMRVSEASSLLLGQIDPQGKSAVIIGKGDKQQQKYFGNTSWIYLSAYLKLRAAAVGVDDWRSLSSRNSDMAAWPVFTRHDKNARKKQKPITQETGENIVHNFVYEALGEKEYDPNITCHTFRHLFVTRVLDQTGDLKTAQELAGHANITTTANYSHRSNIQNQAAHKKIFDG